MLVEEALLTGDGLDGIPQAHFGNTTHQHNFVEHLKRVSMLRQELPPERWDDALHAIVLADIVEPFGMVMRHNNIQPEQIGNRGPEKLTELIEDMPSRHVDIHLHRQVLKNPKLSPKVTDLEDWAGLGVAVQYCDVVVCEKHFANLVARDGFIPRARVETSIECLGEL